MFSKLKFGEQEYRIIPREKLDMTVRAVEDLVEDGRKLMVLGKGTKISWSEYQWNVFYHLLFTDYNLAVSAVAGSGKTTVIKGCLDLLLSMKREAKKNNEKHENVRCLAFNRNIAEKINNDYRKAYKDGKGSETKDIASTLHASGRSKINAYFDGKKKLDVKNDLTKKMFKLVISDMLINEAYRKSLIQDENTLKYFKFVAEYFKTGSKIVWFADLKRLTLMEDMDLFNHYRFSVQTNIYWELLNKIINAELNPQEPDDPYYIRWKEFITQDAINEFVFTIAKEIIRRRVEDALKTGLIEYIDMLYLPYVHEGIRNAGHKYEYLLVDESQDLNAAQMNIVRNMLTPNGRVIFVGDPCQAIQGFAGADDQSFQHLVDEFDCRTLPLSVCYRCPTSHLDLLDEMMQDFDIDIEAAPGAIKGLYKEINESQVPSLALPGNMIICRRNAPLVTMGLKLIAMDKPICFKGADVRSLISEFCEPVFKRCKKFEDEWGRNFLEQIDVQLNQIIDALDDEEIEIKAAMDTYNCILAIYKSLTTKTEESFNSKVSYLLGSKEAYEETDDGFPEDAISLSSFHRAKGLENEVVFIIEADKMTMNQTIEWQERQEKNAQYVALTRSKNKLYLATHSGKIKESKKQEPSYMRAFR